MSGLKLYLLGTPRLEYQENLIAIKRRKAVALMAYLALSQKPQSRDVVASLLWPELDDEHARATLRSTLPALTQAVSVSWLKIDHMTLELRSEAIWVDVWAFLALIAQRRTHHHSGDILCEICAEQLQQAVDLYCGDFLTGFSPGASSEYDHWQLRQREWLRRELANVLRLLATHAAETNQLETAILQAQRWLSLDSLHEPAHRLLMRLYTACGERSEALRQYHYCVDLLHTELATLPEEETISLYEAINANTLPKTPLRPFSQSASILPPLPTLVIGRDNSLAEIKHRLGINASEMRPITVIQGWPGVGKSTTVAKLAHDRDVAEQFPDGVLWTSLGEVPTLLNEIAAWAGALGVHDPGSARKIEDISNQVTAALRNKRVLLIVDDVWHVAHAVPFRVGGQGCATIMTSRLNDLAIALAPTANDIYRLPVLVEAAALELLYKLSPETVTHYPNEAQQLVHDLEGLPLALHVAGRLLNSEAHLGWGVSELLTDLRRGAGLLQAQVPADMVSTHETSPTITALLKRSTDSLSAEARQCFVLLGLFVPKPATFNLEAMAVAWNMKDARPMARLLVSRGLLEPISTGRFQMHALLVWHARSLMDEAIK